MLLFVRLFPGPRNPIGSTILVAIVIIIIFIVTTESLSAHTKRSAVNRPSSQVWQDSGICT